MSVTDPPSNRVETEPREAVTRRWQLIIVAVAFVFPMIVLLISGVLSEVFFRRSTTNPSQRRADAKTIADPKTIDIRCVLHGPSKLCLFRLAALCAHIQGRAHVLQILAQRQGGACAYAAITGGLIGISIPFVFVYAFVGVISAQSADEGVKGISLPDGLLASPYKLVPASSEGVKCNRSS